MPTLPVPLNAGEANQQLTWQTGTDSGGGQNAQILVQSPNSTTLVVLDERAACMLRDFLCVNFGAPGGLEVVRDLPPGMFPPGPNGERP